MQEPKFKIGDRLRDTLTGKSGIVSTLRLSEDNNPKPVWCYSIDSIGWLFYYEEDLEEI